MNGNSGKICWIERIISKPACAEKMQVEQSPLAQLGCTLQQPLQISSISIEVTKMIEGITRTSSQKASLSNISSSNVQLLTEKIAIVIIIKSMIVISENQLYLIDQHIEPHINFPKYNNYNLTRTETFPSLFGLLWSKHASKCHIVSN